MSKTLEMAREFHRLDARFVEITGENLGAADGLLRRRQEWHQSFASLPNNIPPPTVAVMMGYITTRDARGFLRNAKIRFPKTRQQLLAMSDRIMPRLLATSIHQVALGNNLTDKDTRLLLKRYDMRPNGLGSGNQYAFPPEMIGKLSLLQENTPGVGGAKSTMEFICSKMRKSRSWVAARWDMLPDIVTEEEELLDDQGRPRTHYDTPLVIAALQQIADEEEKNILMPICIELDLPHRTVFGRAQQLGISPEHKIGKKGIYDPADLKRLRTNLLQHPPITKRKVRQLNQLVRFFKLEDPNSVERVKQAIR